MTKVLAFDTETTGKWNYQAPFTDVTQPHLVQLGAILHDSETKRNIATVDMLIDPDGKWVISEEVSKIHGITHEMACKFGVLLSNACYIFRDLAKKADVIIAHNIEFDQSIISKAMHDEGLPEMPWGERIIRCTMKTATNIVKAKKTGFGKGYKWPTLTETHLHFYGTGVTDAHTAMADAAACLNVYHKLEEMGAFK